MLEERVFFREQTNTDWWNRLRQDDPRLRRLDVGQAQVTFVAIACPVRKRRQLQQTKRLLEMFVFGAGGPFGRSLMRRNCHKERRSGAMKRFPVGAPDLPGVDRLQMHHLRRLRRISELSDKEK